MAVRGLLHILICLGRVAVVFLPIAGGLLLVASSQNTTIAHQPLDTVITGSIR